jgi:transcription elongation GreA/GreB family factor
VASSAIVSLESDGERACYFLLPVAGGIRVRLGELEVQTLTTTSPLGQALLGATAGDEVALKTPRGPRTYEVVEVR